MFVFDQPKAVNEWVSLQNGGFAPPDHCTAIGWVEDDALVGGIVYYNNNGVNCYANIALKNRRFPRALLHAGLFYAFGQLGLRRLTFFISSANIASINLVSRLGATHEATLRGAEPDGDVLIYALWPGNCQIWSRINGKKRQHPSST